MPSDTLLEDCTIVWLCPLEVELRAAIVMLDEISEDVPPRIRGQNVVYTVGDIGPHKVAVVGYYQEQGLAVSGSMVAEVVRDLPNLQLGLLVGIAGGIPSPGSDMRLGDVAVAVPEGDRPGVVGYDLGKAVEDDGYELKHWQNSTHPLLRSVINLLRARNGLRFRRHLQVLDTLSEFRRPEPGDIDTTDAHPKVHYATILSGNTVVKSRAKRERLRSLYGGIAVEMEAAGMMTRLPVAVIRGISDFADSTKNNAWQPYSAIVAAAYAKEVLLCLPPEHRQSLRRMSGRTLPEKWAFVGRQEEMALLEKELGFPAQSPIQRSVVCLWGLTGCGKSQLAARFVSQQCSSYPAREIFWISGESQESFEQSVISMLKSGSVENPSFSGRFDMTAEKRRNLVDLFFAELDRMTDARWLLVIDGVNEASSSSNGFPFYDIHSYIRGLHRGYILLTSRRRDVVEKYYLGREVRGLDDNDALSLLQLQVHPQLMEGAADLVSMVRGLPLTLRLAMSVISRYRLSVREYLEMWKGHNEACEVLGPDQTLYRSMNLSFEELENVDPTAAKVLTLFSFLHNRDVWYDICLDATGHIYPQWLQELARQKTPFRRFYPLLADLSFIEMKLTSKGNRLWEIHPAIQVIARQRAKASEKEYISCVISLVAAKVPRSFETDAWETMRRLMPHVELCWSYITGGKWGPNTNLTELEKLGHVFRNFGKYVEASLIYRMIVHGLSLQDPTSDNNEFLADVLTNLGLVYTSQQKLNPALDAFDKSFQLMSEHNLLTRNASMSILYNKAVVYMMIDRLDEAELLLRNAAAHFSEASQSDHTLMRTQRNNLYLRILNDMGEVLLRKGSASESLEVFQRICSNYKDWQDNCHPARVLGKYAEARELLENVISVYTEWWGRRHPETMRVINELAWSFMEEIQNKRTNGGNWNSLTGKAEELWNEALIFYRNYHGDESDVVHFIGTNLETLYSLRQPAWNLEFDVAMSGSSEIYLVTE
ncbi:tetratricopeptide repeat domain protein [Aspergillus vadensis CBS 113365]|uniref:Tetratricopeptide repeat domain protein n=1 Tax=Aspergillus vadensis (strain CBS 113365 / IMI 142717 / IBT 24658) TaxID=1448311 RepID=A0A319AWB0_ASPVC|nr:tetratricopeptide repeat domain protein [Aspergillus vadensis CBS 113365]PYH64519.1 tetratricopeptide repeat domain protein [Aspergillus vadensis CBS 113365]